MSRSYRKPWWTEGTKRKPEKRQANKRVRKQEDLSEGNAYKKIYCSWDICDYKIYSPDDVKAYRK